MPLRYRMHTRGDEQALIKLWSEHSGWDQVDAESWAHRLLRPPLGEAAIVVATDHADEIVGQFAFIPVIITIDGREVNALRPFAPILHKDTRNISWSTNPLKHPIAQMYLLA